MSSQQPNFLGIGPEKTATTWIYDMLSLHPELAMPPMKEIGYLWARQKLEPIKFLDVFLHEHWYFKLKRQYIKKQFGKYKLSLKKWQLDFPNLFWDLAYYSGKQSDGWYEKLFSDIRISGDITPTYCEFESNDILAIRERFGTKKIIIGMRDPVEREWSRAKMNCCHKQNRRVEDITDAEWIENYNNGAQADANNYPDLYWRWANAMGQDKIHTIFYDDIVLEPQKCLDELCSFLEVRKPTEKMLNLSERRSNRGLHAEIPRWQQLYLIDKYRASIQDLSDLFPQSEHPERWLSQYSAK